MRPDERSAALTRSDHRQPGLGAGAVLCIGAAAVDRTYRLAAPLVSGTSNPVAGRRGFGGVARNVAENLARLGSAASLITLIGDDDDGRALVEDLTAVGVGTGGVVRVLGRETATYVAVLTPDGELALGLADMAILDGLSARTADRERRAPGRGRLGLRRLQCDGGSHAALADPKRSHRYRLAVDPVSVAKSAHLPDDLHGIDLLVLNRDEAAAILGRRGLLGLDPQESAAALLRAGAAEVVLTLGADGALAANREGVVRVAATPATPVDVTGAGDSLIAAVLYALMGDEPLAAAVAFGCRAAALTVASPHTVDPGLYAALVSAASERARKSLRRTIRSVQRRFAISCQTAGTTSPASSVLTTVPRMKGSTPAVKARSLPRRWASHA